MRSPCTSIFRPQEDRSAHSGPVRGVLRGAAYVDDPAQVSAAQMDAWCRDFHHWTICDTLCIALFDRTAHAWRKVEQWSSRRDEIQKRAAFALLASLALHGRLVDETRYAKGLALIEREVGDERNFVCKGLSWALRSIGRRAALHADALAVAKKLSVSEDASARWIGMGALRDLAKTRVTAKKPAASARRRSGD